MVAWLSSVTVTVEINPVRLAALTIPTENQPPLLIDTDRMKPRQIAAQLLEVIAGRHAQVLIGHGVVNHLELSEQPGFKIRQDITGMGIVHEESPQPAIPKSQRSFRQSD
jgi:phage tail sheath gpL-like